MSETITITKRLEFYNYTKDDCRFSYWGSHLTLEELDTKNVDYRLANDIEQWKSSKGLVHFMGSRTWFKNGMWHREGGPAVVGDGGQKKNYLMGKAVGGWFI